MNMTHNDKKTSRPQSEGTTAVKERVARPSSYGVFILNDDFTPMDFVVDVLVVFFQKTELEATEIMLQVHEKGKGLCGQYSKEIAETKADQVQEHAKKYEFPLRCRIEEVDA